MTREEALSRIAVSLAIVRCKAGRNVLTATGAAFELGRISMCQTDSQDEIVNEAAVKASAEIYELLKYDNK